MSSFLKCVRYATGVWLTSVISASLILGVLFGEARTQFQALTPLGALLYSLPLGLVFAMSICLISRQGWEVQARKLAAILAASVLIVVALSSMWPMGGWAIFTTTLLAFWLPAVVAVLAFHWPQPDPAAY